MKKILGEAGTLAIMDIIRNIKSPYYIYSTYHDTGSSLTIDNVYELFNAIMESRPIYSHCVDGQFRTIIEPVKVDLLTGPNNMSVTLTCGLGNVVITDNDAFETYSWGPNE